SKPISGRSDGRISLRVMEVLRADAVDVAWTLKSPRLPTRRNGTLAEREKGKPCDGLDPSTTSLPSLPGCSSRSSGPAGVAAGQFLRAPRASETARRT